MTYAGTVSFAGFSGSRRDPSRELFAFAHDKVLEAIYTSVPVDRRAAIHIQLAALLSLQHAVQIQQMKAKMRAEHVALGLMQPETNQPKAAQQQLQASSNGQTSQTKGALLTTAQLQQRKQAGSATTSATPSAIKTDPAGSLTVSVPDVAAPAAAAPAAVTNLDFLFEICNHYLKSLHVLAASETGRRDAAELLLLAAVQARSSGSYLTALYFCRASMFLMRLEKVAPTTENSASASASNDASAASDDKRAAVEAINTMDTSEQIAALEQALQRTVINQAPAVKPNAAPAAAPSTTSSAQQRMLHAAAVQSIDNHAAASSGHRKPGASAGRTGAGGAVADAPSTASNQVVAAPAAAAAPAATASAGVSSGATHTFNANVSSSASASTRADLTIKGMTAAEGEAVWAVQSDYSVLYDLSFLRGELEYLCGHHRRSFTAFQLCLQNSTQLRQQIGCLKQLVRLKSISGEYLLALILGVRALSLLHYELTGLRLDGKAWSCDQRQVESLFEDIQLSVRNLGCADGQIGNLFSVLRVCEDPRLQLVGEVLVELIFPALMTSQSLLQLIVFTTVAHSIKHGLCKLEGFAFCMFGASLLAKSVASESFLAKDAQQWGAAGLNLCLQFNNQTDYCRALLANALYINSFTGHLERSVRELKQAIYSQSHRDTHTRCSAVDVHCRSSLALCVCSLPVLAS